MNAGEQSGFKIVPPQAGEIRVKLQAPFSPEAKGLGIYYGLAAISIIFLSLTMWFLISEWTGTSAPQETSSPISQ